MANEAAWRAHMQADYARTITIGGGGGHFVPRRRSWTCRSEWLRPRLWAAPIASFAGVPSSAGSRCASALGKMEKVEMRSIRSDRRAVLSMASPREEDLQPLAQRVRAQPSVPQPLVSITRDERGNTGTVLGLAWSIRY